jgi:hypothetical protein
VVAPLPSDSSFRTQSLLGSRGNFCHRSQPHRAISFWFSRGSMIRRPSYLFPDGGRRLPGRNEDRRRARRGWERGRRPERPGRIWST